MADSNPWQDVSLMRFPSLREDITCDVLVIGGGITGLTAAYLLLKAGKNVCVIERDQLGSGETAHTTAHLTCVTDLRLHQIAKTFGRDGAKLTWQGGAAAINTIERIVSSEKIDCRFRRIPGFLHESLLSDDSTHEKERDSLQADYELAQDLHFESSLIPLVDLVQKPGIRFANQAKFHPLLYLSGLAQSIRESGGSIFEQTEATDFTENPRHITANGRKISAEYMVVATHVPVMAEANLIASTVLQTKLVPSSTYAVGALIPRGKYPEALYWDTSDPYYYLRIDRGTESDYAIFGGADHKTGQVKDPGDRYTDLEKQLKRLIPETRIERRWSGQVIDTHDGLPFMGETATNQFSATGYSGNGMTFGTLAAMMACDAVLGRENPWKQLFSPSRKTLSSGWDYLKENFDFPYYMLRDRLVGTDSSSAEDILPGEGKVLMVNEQRVACSRDISGRLQSVSAICTHMGCVVHWNPTETTWDCPCHGSRFATSGDVLGGPATDNLKPVEIQETSDAR